MNHPNFRSLAGTALLLALMGNTANAQYVGFPNDAAINYTVNGSAIVGYANYTDFNNQTNPTSPTVNIVPGGNVGGLYANNNSTVNVSGGSIGNDLEALNSSTVNLSSGSIGGTLYAFLDGTVNVSGGNIGGRLLAYDSGTFNFFGNNLTNTLVNPNYSGYEQYALYGTLADGTALNGKNLYIQNGSNAKFTFNSVAVPEPGSVALLVGIVTLGASLLRKRRK